jgi:SH3 domain-containing YSC84-like protein 1
VIRVCGRKNEVGAWGSCHEKSRCSYRRHLPSVSDARSESEQRTKAPRSVRPGVQGNHGHPDGIPKDLLHKAECVIVIPSVLKFAIDIGGDFGRGAITCPGQHFTGRWSAPALFALEGANIGFQLGGQATDFVLLVMNPKGANSIMSSKVKLGADAAAAAGPKGRTAAADTDIVMRAEVLTYSRSRGLFAGVSLEGSTLRSDGSANKKLYGRDISAKEIVRQGNVSIPASGRELITLLDKQSPKNESDAVSLKE